MKHTLFAAVVLSAIALSACESKEKTVINTPGASPSTVVVPVPVPGPAGPKGDAGSTTVVVPAATPAK